MISGMNEQAMLLDTWVCKSHNYLTLLGVVTYCMESLIGTVLLFSEWDRPQNEATRVFLLMRLLSYFLLIWSSWDRHIDFECCHPGLHLTWTMVHTLCVVTLFSAQKSARRTALSIFMLVTVFVDISLLLVTWFRLRWCLRVVDNAIAAKEIKGIHPATMRYLDFIQEVSGPEDLTARQLLWSTVHTLGDTGAEEEETEQETDPGSPPNGSTSGPLPDDIPYPSS